jgi:glycosyltransferase involved in cell wall biosynthesis
MTEPLGVSILVINYNNERFLAAAVDSALNQDHPLCEVIVVDDCSTDRSGAVIAQYGDRIRFAPQETNVGQIAALNSAWPLARYPIVIFVDSDDILLPHAAAAVSQRWAASTVKIQFPLVTIDKEGRQLGHLTPKYPPNLDTATIRRELLRTGGSPNSPGTGNAYSRSLLDRMSVDGGFEIENPRDIWMDTILECNAPFYGEVVTLYEPFACYRTHDANDSLQHTVDNGRFDKMSRYFGCKLRYLDQRCRLWGVAFDPAAVRNRSPWALEFELAAAKLGSTEVRVPDPILTVVYHAIKAYVHAPLPVAQRIVRALWFISVAATPRSLARRLIALRFVVTERPPWLERLLTIAHLAGSRGRRSIQTTSR